MPTALSSLSDAAGVALPELQRPVHVREYPFLGHRARWAAAALVLFGLSFPVAHAMPRSWSAVPFLLDYVVLTLTLLALAVWLVHVRWVPLLCILAIGAAGHVWGVLTAHHMIGSIAVTVACGAAGILLSWACLRLSWLALVLVICGAADAFSVWSSHGLTRRLVSSQHESLDWLHAWYGVAGGGFAPSFGLADLVYLGFVFACAQVFRLPCWRGVVAILLADGALFIVGMHLYAPPALPFWSTALLVVYWPFLRTDTALTLRLK